MTWDPSLSDRHVNCFLALSVTPELYVSLSSIARRIALELPRMLFRDVHMHHNYILRYMPYAYTVLSYTRGVQKVLQIDIQKIHKALEFDFI